MRALLFSLALASMSVAAASDKPEVCTMRNQAGGEIVLKFRACSDNSGLHGYSRSDGGHIAFFCWVPSDDGFALARFENGYVRAFPYSEMTCGSKSKKSL